MVWNGNNLFSHTKVLLFLMMQRSAALQFLPSRGTLIGKAARTRTWVSTPSRQKHGRGRMTMWGEDSQNKNPPQVRWNEEFDVGRNKQVPIQSDSEGRRVRRSSQSEVQDDSYGGWDAQEDKSSASSNKGGWDDFSPHSDKPSLDPYDYGRRGQSSSSRSSRGSDRPSDRSSDRSSRRGSDRSSRRGPDRSSRRREPHDDSRRRRSEYDDDFVERDFNRGAGNRGTFSRREKPKHQSAEEEGASRKINLRALEGSGFVHLYGLTPVINALSACKRDFSQPDNWIADIEQEDLENESTRKLYEHELKQQNRKPEAQFSPWLFIQERSSGGRNFEKSQQEQELMQMAKNREIPMARVDKGVLNALSGGRPHQGFVLRCGSLDYEPLSQNRLPHPEDDPSAPKIWLVLDEVVDPQNLGALLRSAYFLFENNIGILVCSKNSAPLSPVVSAASAGALELFEGVFSTSNLPKTLSMAREDQFQILGATMSNIDAITSWELSEVEIQEDRPIVLVLGSEGHGLRTLVARACTQFVQIPGNIDAATGVDSLNVSVAGGILMWHLSELLRKLKTK